MSVTITRAQRDALYEEVLGELTGVGDIYLCLDKGDAEQARRLWERFEAQLRLLDEIGWGEVEPQERFDVDMPPELLARAMGRLQERAEQAVGSHISEPKDGVEVAQRGLRVLSSCRDVLGQLAACRAGERS